MLTPNCRRDATTFFCLPKPLNHGLVETEIEIIL